MSQPFHSLKRYLYLKKSEATFRSVFALSTRPRIIPSLSGTLIFFDLVWRRGLADLTLSLPIAAVLS